MKARCVELQGDAYIRIRDCANYFRAIGLDAKSDELRAAMKTLAKEFDELAEKTEGDAPKRGWLW